ncbi:hypothetical protein V496_03308 [Pseudogymnoascus sp. VKM F-4515 (FW-2607)]|nr:hypothetical protein V496_03308 [Pseudogymnoascus sp. VKM F-4515 (FW-2607)]
MKESRNADVENCLTTSRIIDTPIVSSKSAAITPPCAVAGYPFMPNPSAKRVDTCSIDFPGDGDSPATTRGDAKDSIYGTVSPVRKVSAKKRVFSPRFGDAGGRGEERGGRGGEEGGAPGDGEEVG